MVVRVRRIITLVRHAQSIFNKTRATHARNSALTLVGVEQAKRLVLPEDTHPVDTVYVSPMRRCQETLQHSPALRDTARRVLTLDMLREFKIDADAFRDDEAMHPESIETLHTRIELVKQILRTDDSDHIVLLGHRDFFWHMTCVESGHEKMGVCLDNAEALTFDRELLLGP